MAPQHQLVSGLLQATLFLFSWKKIQRDLFQMANCCLKGTASNALMTARRNLRRSILQPQRLRMRQPQNLVYRQYLLVLILSIAAIPIR